MVLSQYVCKAFSPKTSRLLSTWTDKFDKYLLGSAPVTERHSKLLAKKDIIYGVEIHDIQPGKIPRYLENAELVLPSINTNKDIPVSLYGQFHVEFGKMDRIYTIWKYTGGYKHVQTTVDCLNGCSVYRDYQASQYEMIRERDHQLCYEFSFWPQYTDDYDGGIFEIRSYTLKAGCLYEWANAWAQGIKLRQDDAVMGLCSQIGGMYRVHHIWRYRDLTHRQEMRNSSWQSGQWGDVVVRTVPLIRNLEVNILKPAAFSPLR